jgi:serine/threonine protein phosphatase PrpC
MTLLRLLPAMGTHVGMRRRHNEDSIGYRYPDDVEILQESGALFVVADGVGGLSAGERASSMAVERLIKHYYAADSEIPPDQRLAIAFQQVNQDVYKLLNDPGKPAATTMVAVVVLENQLIAASVGDSQIFLIRNDDIQQLNQVDVLRDGSAEDGALTKAIGYREILDVDTILGSLEPDDVLILCSDGLTRYLNNQQLVRLARLRDPRDSVRRMINETNQKGGADNVSVAIIRIGTELEATDVRKHVQKLVVPVAVDSQPVMTPNVDTKPNTSIPLSRPEPVLPETFPVTENLVSDPKPQPINIPRQTDRVTPPPPETGRNYVVLIAIAVLVLGAVLFFGALFFLRQPQDSLPTATIETTVEATEQLTPTADISATTLTNATITVGDAVTVAGSLPTLVRVGESVGSFVTIPDTPYIIQEIFESSEGQLWYRLLDEESNQTGWIAASDVTPAD